MLLGPWARHTTSVLLTVRTKHQNDKLALEIKKKNVFSFPLGIHLTQGKNAGITSEQVPCTMHTLCSIESKHCGVIIRQTTGLCVSYLSGHWGCHLRSLQSQIHRMKWRQKHCCWLAFPLVISPHHRSLKRQLFITAIFTLWWPSAPLTLSNCCSLNNQHDDAALVWKEILMFLALVVTYNEVT